MSSPQFLPQDKINVSEWNDRIRECFPHAPFLQTPQWAEVKAPVGWTPFYYVHEDAGKTLAAAMVLERTLRVGGFAAKLRIHYVPKGPLIHDQNDVDIWMKTLETLRAFAQQV